MRMNNRAIAIPNNMHAAQPFKPLICHFLAVAPLSGRALLLGQGDDRNKYHARMQ